MLIDRLVRYLLPRQDLFFTSGGGCGQDRGRGRHFRRTGDGTSRDAINSVAVRIKPIETEADGCVAGSTNNSTAPS